MHELKATRTMPIGIEDLIGEGLTIHLPEPRAIVSVQIGRAALTAMEAATLRGVPWPCYPNTTAGRDPLIWWLGPGRWFVSSEEMRAPELIVDLTAITEGHLAAIVDVSDSLKFIRLVGKASRQLLARNTDLGLDDRVPGSDRCARTRLAHVAVLLRPLEENGYELLVDRSEAQFLLEWLRDSAVGLELSRPDTRGVAPMAQTVAMNFSSASSIRPVPTPLGGEP